MATDAPRIAWLLNLDADLELRDPARYRAAQRSVAPSASATRFTDLVAPEDAILDAAGLALNLAARPTASPECVVQVFCPTPSALARVKALGFTAPPAPDFSTLRRVNDRAFCAELGHGLPGAAFTRDMPALEAHLARASFTGRYVIKRAFSFAGREQRRVEGQVLDASTLGFCRRSFARGEGVQIEPWVERLADFSQHGQLSQTGQLLVGPLREQHCDRFGRFVAVSTQLAAVTDAEREQFASELQRTAAALSQAGYFGPFGIDGFRYRLPDGSTALNPRCEINARFTMGYPRALLLAALQS